MNSRRFGTFGFVVLTLAALLNVATVYTAEHSFAALRDAVTWVRHTEDAGNRIEHIYRRAVDAETGQRGYRLTLDATYLQPYSDARLAIPKDIEELGRLTQGNPVQVAQLATVRTLLEARFAQMEESLALERDHGGDSPRALLVSQEGLATMSSLRLALDGMTAEQRTQNELRIKALTDNQNQVRRGLLVVFALNLVLVTLGGCSLARNRAAAAGKRPTPRNATCSWRRPSANGPPSSPASPIICSGCRKRRRRRSRGRSTMSLAARSPRPRSICNCSPTSLPSATRSACGCSHHGRDRRHDPGQAPHHREPSPDAPRQSRHRRRAEVAMQPVRQAIERALPGRDAGREPPAFPRLTASRSIASCRKR